jgi:hypothetical protein
MHVSSAFIPFDTTNSLRVRERRQKLERGAHSAAHSGVLAGCLVEIRVRDDASNGGLQRGALPVLAEAGLLDGPIEAAGCGEAARALASKSR